MPRHLAWLKRDIAYSLRQMSRAPAFASAAVASLGLAIAVNSATFSVVTALLLRPVVASDRGDVVRIGRSRNGDGSFRTSSYRDFRYLREHASTLSTVFGEQIRPLTLGGAEGAEIVSGEVVTGNYFAALDISPARGRVFSADDDQRPGGAPVVVISDGLWRRRFNADGGAIGRVVTINTGPFTIIGVAPPAFRGTFPGVSVDLWIPSMMAGVLTAEGPQDEPPSLMLMGRIRPDQSLASASAELDILARQLARDDPGTAEGRGFTVAPARGAHPLVARLIGTFLWLLLGIVSLVLLIAGANVAGLLLARATARRGELAVRLALGASRARLISQLMVESLLLAAAGATAGLLLTTGALRVINALVLVPGPTGAPVFADLRLDLRIVGFTITASVLTALIFGLTPALEATRVDLVAGLKTSSAASAGRGRSRLRAALVMAQVTLSVTLLIAAMLLSRSLVQAAQLNVGFNPDGLSVLSFNLELPGYDDVRRVKFHRELLDRTRALPGVAGAALADFVPMGDRGGSVELTNADAEPGAAPDRTTVAYNRVSEGYFAVLEQSLLRGRELTDTDRADSPGVAIVNEALARRYWPTTSALGRRLRISGEQAPREVVGVVANARYKSFGGTIGPLVVLPALQRRGAQLTLHVRSKAGADPVLADVLRLARDIDPQVAPQKVTTMRAAMAFSLFPAQVARAVFGAAGLIGLVLAASGLYGLVAYTCELRLKEIGIRIALGARRLQVFRAIAGGTIVLVLAGLIVGAGTAAAIMRLFAAFLYGVSPWDPLTFAIIAIVLLGVTLAATTAAARRGLNLDPAVILKD
jgi:predicted permease